MSRESNSAILSTDQLTIGYRVSGKPPLVLAPAMNLELRAGEVVSLLGPNGSGKSTLIRTLAGLHPAISGGVEILGQVVKSNQVLQTARVLSLVLTDRIEVQHLTVRQLVSMGRYPYTGWLGRLGNQDKEKVEEAMHLVRMTNLADQCLHDLSDGEQQRALLAKALAQDTPVIILDEPTAHLDLPNRISLMRTLRNLTRETTKAIIFSSHDLDLAIHTADRFWLMKRGRSLIDGKASQFFDGKVLNEVFTSGLDPDEKLLFSDYLARLTQTHSE
ncbi:MAG: ABC transporter ATP-binding protein [Bacteroidales bacterium]